MTYDRASLYRRTACHTRPATCTPRIKPKVPAGKAVFSVPAGLGFSSFLLLLPGSVTQTACDFEQAVGSHGSIQRLRVRAQAAQGGSSATFSIRVPFLQLGFGDVVKLVGEQESFGGWSLTAAPALAWTEGHNWVGTFELAPDTYQFKVCKTQTGLHLHVHVFVEWPAEAQSALAEGRNLRENCISWILPHQTVLKLPRLLLAGSPMLVSWGRGRIDAPNSFPVGCSFIYLFQSLKNVQQGHVQAFLVHAAAQRCLSQAAGGPTQPPHEHHLHPSHSW